jgi:hypothetical protein
MRHFSRGLVSLLVLCLFGRQALFAAACNDRGDFQLPVQAGYEHFPAFVHGLVRCHNAADLT